MLAAARRLARPALHSLPAAPLAVAAAAAGGLALLATQTAPTTPARFAAVALASGAALAVPDPSAPTVEAVPVARWLRVAVRLAPLLAGWFVVWAAVLACARPPDGLALTAEALVLLVAAVAVARVAEGRDGAGLAGAVTPLVLLGVGLLAPGPVGVLDGASPSVGIGLVVVGAAALAAAAASVADPGGRRALLRAR